ncbi:T9SS type A sorting domain-containing protein [Panacibacter sp. KCS-6]|uniref:T9SS type A sorting domain-containing protein n=2 Tax=Limnovirga soli TaxID=2656915 RepID=A0A8J8JYB9_9BACT|nr:T9SS type A sorting domain-containing protein [Limnovirga soli]
MYKLITMKKNSSIYYPLILLVLLMLGNGIVSAQDVFQALPVNASYAETNALKKIFKTQTIVQLDAQAVYQFIKKSGNKSSFVINAGNNYHWNISLEQHDLRSPDYLLQSTTNKGLITLPKEEISTYAGFLKDGPNNYVRMNIEAKKISANIIDHGVAYYLEPLKKFVPSAAPDKYIIYKRGDSRPVEGVCRQVASAEQQVNQKLSSIATPAAADCRIIEIATESDWENFAQGVTASDILANLNFVEPLYQNYFGASIVVKYQHQWAISSDPYTATDLCGGSPERLSEFKSYWQANFTSVKRDVNILYSGVDFTGGTIGCAYVGVFSGSTSDACYAVAQWITSYPDEKREVLVAHEMGHIFGCVHDETGCSSTDGPIMCPNINAVCYTQCTPYWSTLSFSSIISSFTSSNGSARLRLREFFQSVNTAFSLGLPYSASGNNLFVASGNIVTNGFFGPGLIAFTGTDNVTLQPGFSASVASGLGNFTAQIGPCNQSSQLTTAVPMQVPAKAITATPIAENIKSVNTAIKVYPNPFSSIANIEISLPKTAHISLSVYDPSGRLIDKPVNNKPMLAGTNNIPYTNKQLSANYYLFVIEIDGVRFTEKVIKLP